ncbi:MAG: Ig-like domain-containing protein [Anaerobutyricum sp.]
MPKLENASAKMVVETTREVEVVNTANACRWSSSSGQVASVDNNGTVAGFESRKDND